MRGSDPLDRLRIDRLNARIGIRALVAAAAFIASVGVSAAAGASGSGATSVVLLQLCEIPLLGDLAAWLLPNLREIAIFGGIVTALFGAVAAPADFRISPRMLVIGGLLVFGAGLLWVGIVTYFGTEVLGGDASLINAATCGMEIGA